MKNYCDNYQEAALTPVLYFLGNNHDDFPDRPEGSENAYKDGNNIDFMGHCITIGLSRQYDDWLLFNLASIFWRIKELIYFLMQLHADKTVMNVIVSECCHFPIR